MMRRLVAVCAAVLIVGSVSALAQQGPQATTLVSEGSVTGVPDKVFTLIAAAFPPGVSTGRHTHPRDEYAAPVP